MESLVQNCDILFHECSYGPILMDMERDVLTMEDYDYDELERKMLQQAPYKARWDKIEAAAILWRHSTAEMAGSYATKVKAKKLVVFHLGRSLRRTQLQECGEDQPDVTESGCSLL